MHSEALLTSNGERDANPGMLAQELLLLLWKGFKLLTVHLTESATEAIRQTQETHHEGSREDTYSE